MQGQRDADRLFEGELLSLPNRHFRTDRTSRGTQDQA